MKTPLFSIDQISFGYLPEERILDSISFEIEKGEFIFLTGPSGAGKSTLLKLIFCAQKPNRGQLLVNGRNIARLSRSAIPYLRRNIGVVFQDFKLLPRRTVEENVSLAREILGVPRKEIQRRTAAILKQVGLAHKGRHHPHLLLVAPRKLPDPAAGI